MGWLLDEAFSKKSDPSEGIDLSDEDEDETDAQRLRRKKQSALSAERRAIKEAEKENKRRRVVKKPIAPEVEKIEVKEIVPNRTVNSNKEVRARRPYRGFLTHTIRAQMQEMMQEGASIGAMAEALGVCTRTISLWKNKVDDSQIPEERIREVADNLVENSLLKRAIGYNAPKEVVQFSKEGEVWKTDTFTHIPPDPDSAKFWLKNRQPTRWRDHIDTDVTLIPRLVIQTHQGDEVLHDAATILENTPKMLTDAAGAYAGEFPDEDKGVGAPQDDEDEKPRGNDVFEEVPGKPGVDATEPDDPSAPEAK